MEKMFKMVANGARSFLLLIRTLQPFWAERMCIRIIFNSGTCWVLDSKIPRFKALSQREPVLRDSSAVAPDHKVGEIQGTRATRENPMNVNIV